MLAPSRAAPQPPRLLTPAEARFFFAVLVGLCALGALGLDALLAGTDVLYDDLRKWRFSTPGREVPLEYLDDLQPRDSRAPLRLVLKLDRIPQAGDAVSAERTFRVDPAKTYCFDVFVVSDYYNPTVNAIAAFRTGVFVNGRREAWFPIADRKVATPVHVTGIEPVDGRVHVRFEVRSLATKGRPSWQRASTVVFDFARLYPCGNRPAAPAP